MEYYLAIKKKKDLYISNNPENEKKKQTIILNDSIYMKL